MSHDNHELTHAFDLTPKWLKDVLAPMPKPSREPKKAVAPKHDAEQMKPRGRYDDTPEGRLIEAFETTYRAVDVGSSGWRPVRPITDNQFRMLGTFKPNHESVVRGSSGFRDSHFANRI